MTPAISYPFASTVQCEEAVAELKRFVAAWTDRFALRGSVELIHIWATHNSPPLATQEDLEFSVMFLCIYFYFNDYDLAGSEYKRLVDDYVAVFQGKKELVDERSIHGAISEFFRRLSGRSRKNSMPLSPFVVQLERMKSAYVWENQSRTNDPFGMTLDAYLQWREYTGTVYPYLEMWKIVGGYNLLPLLTEERTRSAIRRLEKLCVVAIGLANDLASIAQDVVKRKLNSVLLVQRRDSLSQEQAIAQILALHDAQIRDYCALKDQIFPALSTSPVLNDYLRFLEICVQGSLDAMNVLRDRYSLG